MRQILPVVLAVFGFAACSAQAQTTPITYTVTPEVKDGQLQDLLLEVRLTGDADGSTRFQLPTAWSGAQDLQRAVFDITADGGEARLETPIAVVVRHAPRADITLRYRVRQDFRGPISTGNGSPFRPTTQAKWFTAVGWTLFPEVAGRERSDAAFRWGPVPAGWNVASDLDHASDEPRAIDEVLDSVLVGGEGMQVIERQAAGGRIRMAIHGDWKFDENKLADLQGRIAEESATFWQDRGEEFFVAVTPLVSPEGATVQYGVGLGDAFSLWATTDVAEKDLRHILAHEHQHAWFPNRVGGVRSGRDEPLDYWLSEGFTDFYTLRLLLRSGVWGLEDFVEDYNRILKTYAGSPVRDAPNGLIAAKFWEDRDVADLPYQRGLLVAAMWDDRLRRTTGGSLDLDDVVLAMKVRAQRPGSMTEAAGNLKAAYRQLGGGDLAGDFRRFVDGGERVMLPADLFGDCARVRTYELPVFDRGFDTALTGQKGGVVDGVDPAGPAYAAGLRNGMRILRREAGDNQDSRVDLIYRVEVDGKEQLIRYKPQGREHVTYQDIVLAGDMTPEKRTRCTKVMAGS